MSLKTWVCAIGLFAVFHSQSAHARPIVFARSTTVMAEYRGDAMAEAQVFYAPRHNWSFGLGHLDLDSGDMDARHSVTYLRVNFLARRWNLEAAQANIFLWGGAGNAYIAGGYFQPPASGVPPSGHNHGGPPATPGPIWMPATREPAWNAGGQIDFETRRFYTSFKVDSYDSRAFTHGAETLQFGIAPYEHDVDSLATWFVISGRRYTGNMHEGTEVALLLRLFKKAAWVEAGATTDGRLQAMAMFSF